MTKDEIKELRTKLGLTQEEFARLLGVGFTTVNRWENGKAVPILLLYISQKVTKDNVSIRKDYRDIHPLPFAKQFPVLLHVR